MHSDGAVDNGQHSDYHFRVSGVTRLPLLVLENVGKAAFAAVTTQLTSLASPKLMRKRYTIFNGCFIMPGIAHRDPVS